MKKVIKPIFVFILLVFCNACQNNSKPQIVPAIMLKPDANAQEDNDLTAKHSIGVIGATEPIYFLPIESSFLARIDTGAQTSSLDAKNIIEFERDGEKWVSFELINRQTNERYFFQKKIVRKLKVKRIEKDESRIAVMMNVSFGGEIIRAEFTLAQREKFDYQILIGRNILSGRAIVDASLDKTLR